MAGVGGERGRREEGWGWLGGVGCEADGGIPNSHIAVTCSSDLSIKIWDTNNEWKNVKTLFGHDHTISSARWMPSDDFIVSAGRDRTIRVWEVASG